ncbi:ankyrin repeat and SOCS box protein 2 isoform X2 [Tachysurus fulvidraco]|uniref:ankyrin repeat and SOCS box protein 2 isoform X2 n=1 Tax=Tachysurus fulvidraco TaxID=1234273 RepID=UPI000F50CBFC|nr:ankyrin repeat and SOCS box protein 2 isoform X2 [Tachysurus fulvidraco]
MAATGGPILGATNPTVNYDDFYVYGYMSDDELMQMAIERSLTETHNNSTTSSAENARSPIPQRRTEIPQPSRHQTLQLALTPPPCPANPPRDRKDQQSVIVSHFVTGYGKRMVAYRTFDGTLIEVKPEAEEDVDPVVKAIREGDVDTLRGLIKKADCNLLMSNEYGWIPLHEAAHFGQEQCIRALLRVQPGMINKRTPKDQTALLLAVTREKQECVACLLEKGADPDIANKDKETPLYKACEKENAAIVAMLLNHNAMVNKSCIQGWTALHEAVCRNNVEICEMLVKAGAKISTPNIYGITPIFVAAQSGNIDTLRFLLKNGADINSQAADGATALYEASKNGHVEIVEFLLSQKADANKPGKTGLLPIHIAAQRGNNGTDLFTFGSAHKTDRALQIVTMLIPATSKSRVKRCGISPLHLAAERNRDEILEVLIKSGFDVNAMLSEDRRTMYEDHRRTTLYFSVINNNIEATRMLLQAGANPNLDTFSPLLIALRQGCMSTMTLLVQHGANVNAYIPLHPTTFPATIMFCMKYLVMLKYLMDNGCDALSCFSCVHGSNPHPPLKTIHSERRSYRDNQPILHSTCTQFCEVVSMEMYSRWVGPIIDVLLDYVGDVKLCSRLVEHLDSYPDWASIKEKAMPPRPLMQLCRLKIRQLIGNHRLNKIKKLPLPGRLIKFLNHEERTKDF